MHGSQTGWGRESDWEHLMSSEGCPDPHPASHFRGCPLNVRPHLAAPTHGGICCSLQPLVTPGRG